MMPRPTSTRPIRLVALDMDGTLTQHKSPLGEQNRAALDRLRERHQLVMVGAGMTQRIHRQLGEYPIDVIGCYGMETAEWDETAGELRLTEQRHVPALGQDERDQITATSLQLRGRHGCTEFVGESVEFHASGMLTFALLGTQARIEDKLAFDPDRSRRRAFYAEVCQAFSQYTVFVGGSSSFDIVPKPFDKFHALSRYCSAKGFELDEVTYIGDDYGPGGNDEQVYHSPIRFLTIDDHTTFPQVAAQVDQPRVRAAE